MILHAQTTGKVRINAVPEQGLEYVLDGKYRMTQREVTLSEGDHRFIFWAPEHAMLDTTIFVMGNHTYNLNVRLQRPLEYVQFRQSVDRYQRRQRLARVVPPIVTGAFGAWAVVSTIRFGKANSDLKDMQVQYEELADPAAIQRLKYEEIPNTRERFQSTRTQTYISSGLFVASLGVTAYLRHRMARTSAPVYEDQERVRFQGLVWVPGPGGGVWATGITIGLR